MTQNAEGYDMQKEKGIAYCGLACCTCSENETCVGCRNEGCKDKEWCKNFRCCKAKGIQGCWECLEFPCTGSMLDKVRIRSFAQFVKEFGEEEMIRCLEKNEAAGIIYHYPGQLVGDYDRHDTEREIMNMLKEGK